MGGSHTFLGGGEHGSSKHDDLELNCYPGTPTSPKGNGGTFQGENPMAHHKSDEYL